jgi:hypothetical protein
MTTHTTSTVIKLRNKLTGLYYADGRCFNATEADATPVVKDSVDHALIRYTFLPENMVEVGELASI